MKTIFLWIMAAFYFARYLAVAAIVCIVAALMLKIIWFISDALERIEGKTNTDDRSVGSGK